MKKTKFYIGICLVVQCACFAVAALILWGQKKSLAKALAITAGIGLRVHIPGIGPMSIDYGLPLINPGNYGSENGYFTFGTGGLNGYGHGYGY